MYFYFRKYLVLIVFCSLGITAAMIEKSRTVEEEVREKVFTKLVQKIDDPDSYYQFQMEMYSDRAYADYLKGMLEFKKSQNKLKEANAALSNKDPEAAKKFRLEAFDYLKQARIQYEKAIDRGLVSEEALYDFYALTMKSLLDQGEVTEEEFQLAVKKWRKHFPLAQSPPSLEGY